MKTNQRLVDVGMWEILKENKTKGAPKMQLEAGKFYKTRDGKKAYVAAIGNPLQTIPSMQAVGWIDGSFSQFSWALSGQYSSATTHADLDLISEWKEPKKLILSLWFNVYINRHDNRLILMYYNTKEEADRNANNSRIACFYFAKDIREDEWIDFGLNA